MSIHTITCEQFMLLTAAQHQLALTLYDREIEKLVYLLARTWAPDEPQPTAAQLAEHREQLDNLLKLREVHQTRLDELTETDGSTAATAPSDASH